MSIFKHLIVGAAQMGKYAAAGVAQKQMAAEHRSRARRNPVDTKDAKEGCTPCAAKKKGAEMANGIWK